MTGDRLTGRRSTGTRGATRRPTAAGFTLVEAALSVAIVGVMLTCAMTGLSGIARQRRVLAERRAAVSVASQLLAEVCSQPFTNAVNPTFGPAPGQVRSTFAGVDDYDGYTESPPTLYDGTVLADYAGWKRSVAVVYVTPTTLAVSSTATTLKRATVTVTAPSGKQYALVALRTSAGVNEYPPQVQTYLLPFMAVSVQAGTARTSRTAGRPMNVTASQN